MSLDNCTLDLLFSVVRIIGNCSTLDLLFSVVRIIGNCSTTNCMSIWILSLQLSVHTHLCMLQYYLLLFFQKWESTDDLKLDRVDQLKHFIKPLWNLQIGGSGLRVITRRKKAGQRYCIIKIAILKKNNNNQSRKRLNLFYYLACVLKSDTEFVGV